MIHATLLKFGIILTAIIVIEMEMNITQAIGIMQMTKIAFQVLHNQYYGIF